MLKTILPKFSALDLANFPKQLELLLHNNLHDLTAILADNKIFTWDNLLTPLENFADAVERLWAPLSYLHGVLNTKKVRNCYKKCLPKLDAYEAAIAQNQALFIAIQSIDQQTLNVVQQKICLDLIRDFKLAGVALSRQKQKIFNSNQKRLSKLANLFENNILDSTQAYSLHITDLKRLDGLPKYLLDQFQTLAKQQKLAGWLLKIDEPSYHGLMTYANDRSLRQEVYTAHITRASSKGPGTATFDNTKIMEEILAKRLTQASLLGFDNYAEFSLATKMAESTARVMDFLNELKDQAYHKAKEEFQQMEEFARVHYAINNVQPWDLAFLTEQQRQKNYALAEEELRVYFPVHQVLTGLLQIIERLYSITMQEIIDLDVWQKDVQCYQVVDGQERVRGFIYMDLYAREDKRSGAWMTSLQSRRKLADNSVQLPIAVLTCNFTPPTVKSPSLLLPEEVVTLFHEFGHCLHHVLTQVDYFYAAGMNGVEWDAVELPSQFFENWCWQRESLVLLTSHVITKCSLPEKLLTKLLAIKNFHAAMLLMRQLEFALFDFAIHHSTHPIINDLLAKIRAQVRVIPVASFDRFANSFAHIFSDHYAAGYYSYLWAEVLASDAFARFTEEGLFNKVTGQDFLHSILEVGSTKKAAEAFLSFRGRNASINSFLQYKGIL